MPVCCDCGSEVLDRPGSPRCEKCRAVRANEMHTQRNRRYPRMLFDRVLISDLDSDIERLRAENAKIREQLDALDDLRRIGNRG